MTSLQTPPLEPPSSLLSSAGPSAGPFRPAADLDVDAFREALARANFTATGLNGLRRGTKSMEAIDLALLRHRTGEPTPFNTLAALFHLNLPVRLEALRAAVHPLPIAQLFAAGLVQEDENGVRASARIEIYRDLLICSDFLHLSPDIPLAPNHVLGVGPGAISLAALTPHSAVESVLDLGTGGGIQALLAAPHAERVIATDICPRALNFAAMNARLNKVENIELRIGSFFDPVEGERFDRIIANPPFVISPRSGLIYRDGGLEGDAVSELVVREAAAHLDEEGLAVMLVNWHHATEDDWEKRPQSWTEGNGCDVRWMHFSDEDPATYAASWLRQERGAPGETIGTMLGHWLEYYASLGIVHIALGAVVMRKHSGRPNWLRCEHIPMDIAMTPCGDQIERIFDAQDLLQGLEDERDLLRERFKVHPSHRLEQQLAAQEGGWALHSNKLHLTSGMDFCAEVDMPTLHFLAQLDGTKTLAECAHAVADSLGRTIEEVIPVCFQITKRMLRIGLLVRA